MARHNRNARGEDQRGHEYVISYQPDWLHQIKITRDLPSGRQSTKTLFRNPDPAVREPGPTVRTEISAPDLGLDVHVAFDDPWGSVQQVTVEAVVPQGPERGQTVVFSLFRKRQRSRSSRVR